MVEADKPTTTAPERVSKRLQGGGCIYAGLGSMPEQGQAGTHSVHPRGTDVWICPEHRCPVVGADKLLSWGSVLVPDSR